MPTWSKVSNPPVTVSRKVVASGFLLRLGISGVALVVWAAASLANPEVRVWTAIAALGAGVAIAILSFRKARSLLEQDSDRGRACPAVGRIRSITRGSDGGSRARWLPTADG